MLPPSSVERAGASRSLQHRARGRLPRRLRSPPRVRAQFLNRGRLQGRNVDGVERRASWQTEPFPQRGQNALVGVGVRGFRIVALILGELAEHPCARLAGELELGQLGAILELPLDKARKARVEIG